MSCYDLMRIRYALLYFFYVLLCFAMQVMKTQTGGVRLCKRIHSRFCRCSRAILWRFHPHPLGEDWDKVGQRLYRAVHVYL